MRSRRLCGLFLALLLAGLPALAKPLPGESPKPRPSFLTCMWDHVRELLPLLATSEAPPPAAAGPESPNSESNPDLGLGMDPNG
ncbi:MAG: hypothetical protein ACJ76J_30590 [Thermoanaerobaculia bacterium]